MGYRNITVIGKKYQYVIGKKFLKFRHGISVSLDDISQCMLHGSYIVTPYNISRYLQGYRNNDVKRVFHCEFHGTHTTDMDVNPYTSEIYKKNNLMMKCENCLDELAGDI